MWIAVRIGSCCCIRRSAMSEAKPAKNEKALVLLLWPQYGLGRFLLMSLIVYQISLMPT